MTREFVYASPAPIRIWKFTIRFPPVGPVLAVLSHFILAIVLSFYGLTPYDQWNWEDLGYKLGWVSIAQLPLIFLLAGKRNLIGYVTGFSYERLNWFHRWAARTLWVTTSIHMLFWFIDWARYDYIKIKITTDSITKHGIIAWSFLTMIMLVSFVPLRRLNYEIFLVSHIVLFIGFTVGVYLHATPEVKIWVWVSIALYVADRFFRSAAMLLNNLAILHPWLWKANRCNHTLWANHATLTPLPGDVTRISIDKPVMSWTPGQHAFLACHTIAPFQSHPFTITSIPSDGKLEFLVRAQKGGTRRFLDHARRHYHLLPTTNNHAPTAEVRRRVAVDGPYGSIRNLGQFDSIVFFAGGTGATYTVPLLRSVVYDWRSKQASPKKGHPAWMPLLGAATRRIRFVWVVKSRDQYNWFRDQLEQVIEEVEMNREQRESFSKEVEITVYVTCDPEFTEEGGKAACGPSQPSYGRIQELSSSTEYSAGSYLASPTDPEKKAMYEQAETVSVRSVTSTDQSASENGKTGGCGGPNGTCCCATNVDDDSSEPRPPCCCAGPSSSSSSSPPDTPRMASVDLTSREAGARDVATPTATPTAEAFYPLSRPAAARSRIRILTGRPATRKIIRKMLEQAEGESAVVACGPAGLTCDVRRDVVALSDERAVHKGTGAQGIYLHVENFCF